MSSIAARVLFRKWDLVRTSLFGLLGSWKQTEMLLTALRIQAVYGECFASARFLAGSALASEKTWDRLVTKLYHSHLITTWRRIRPNGQQGTNFIDLRRLWRFLDKLLEGALTGAKTRIYRVLTKTRYILFKWRVGGIYRETLILPLNLAPHRRQ